MRLASVIRFDYWWYSKIPPLVSTACIVLLARTTPLPHAPWLMLSVLWTIACVAAYGHILNDVFDIESDRRAGKPNRMADKSAFVCFAACAGSLAVGLLPLLVVDYGAISLALLGANCFLPALYSLPPIRFKERGAPALICDAGAAHVLPTLFVVSTLSQGDERFPSVSLSLLLVLAATASLLGLKGILGHMLGDRQRDVASGVQTVIARSDPVRAARLVVRLCLFAELPTALLLCLLLLPMGPFALGALLTYLVLEATKGLLGWRYDRLGEVDVPNVPFVNNYFHEVFLPLAVTLQLVFLSPIWLWLLVLQIVVFLPNVHDFVHQSSRLVANLTPLLTSRFRRWRRLPELQTSGDGQARLIPTGFARSVRVEIDRGGAKRSDVRLVWSVPAVVSGGRYRVQFQVRADRARLLAHGLIQAESPWANLGLYQELEIGTTWRTVVTDFVANANEARPCPCIWLGNQEAAIEVANFHLAPTRADDFWMLSCQEGCQAQRLASTTAKGVIHIDVSRGGDSAWGVRLWRPVGAVKAGTVYRARFRARADQPRRLIQVLSQSREPWHGLGLYQEVELDTQWREFVADFEVSATEDFACHALALGAESVAVQLTGLQFDVLSKKVSNTQSENHG